jgi:SAM-dependent methyltransferase
VSAMANVADSNAGFIGCWNEILTPKWIRFRHLLSGNGKLHSDVAMPRFGIQPGERVLDLGCGFGETTLELGRLVGPSGAVLGLDCTSAFLEIAERERDQAGATNVRYELGDAQVHPLAPSSFDVAYARFGVMFFQSAVRALRNVHRALVPGGALCLIVWRGLADNPAWGAAREIVRRHLPPPGEGAATCGPGPFSWANEETDRRMLAAAGFTDIDLFERNDLPMCVGRSVEEAIDYQLLVGPSGEIVREAGEPGMRSLPQIRAELAGLFRPSLRGDGVYLDSSTWFIRARKRTHRVGEHELASCEPIAGGAGPFEGPE